jgi:hypothetical protein
MISVVTQSAGNVIVGIGTDSGGLFSAFHWLWAIPLAIAIGLWLLLARSSLVRGGSMERPERVPQLYGYTVCLVAIVVMLASVSTIVEQSFAISDPLTSTSSFGWAGEPSLTSFEAYKATRDMTFPGMANDNREAAQRAEPTESELRTRYEALRTDRMRSVRRRSQRELASSGILFLIAAALFSWHWRWVRGSKMLALAAAPTSE